MPTYLLTSQALILCSLTGSGESLINYTISFNKAKPKDVFHKKNIIFF